MRKKPLFPFHPFCIGIFPILSLFALNLSEVGLAQTVRSVGFTLLVTGLLFGLFFALTRNIHRAGLVVSFWSILFFSFGKVYEILVNTLPYGSLWAQANVLLAFWAAMWILGTWALIRLLRSTDSLTQIMNVVAVTVLISAAFPLVQGSFQNIKTGPVRAQSTVETNLRPGPGWSGKKPDIYYIVLDGYARQDVLQSFYGIDNQSFIDTLQAKGFTVALNSHTNYWRTTLSLASSLNFHYLEDLVQFKPGSSDYAPLENLIRDNAVWRFLDTQGYQIISFETSYTMTEDLGTDIVFKNHEPINQFERTLLTGSLAVFYMDQMAPEYHRRTIRSQFQQLAETTSIPGPKFVFAHLMVPHPPFVFAADGTPVVPIGWTEGGAVTRTVEQYIQGYGQQHQYTNLLVEATVQAILANASTPPVIILQSDHGPGAYMDLSNAEITCAAERLPNFSAFYLPGAETIHIPEDITPVNIFRIVFNGYFDTGLELEENRMYGIAFLYPYDLHEFTDRLDWCPALNGNVTSN